MMETAVTVRLWRLTSRLLVCVGWEQIPCVLLKLESVIAGESAEDEFRKQFRTSERAAIGKAIEKDYGVESLGPSGNPTQLRRI